MGRVTIDSSGNYQPQFWCDICKTYLPRQCPHLPLDAAEWQPEPEQDPEPIADGGPAFPVDKPGCFDMQGMSLRDWFAGQALAGMRLESHVDDAAFHAYMIADAMLRRREKQ